VRRPRSWRCIDDNNGFAVLAHRAGDPRGGEIPQVSFEEFRGAIVDAVAGGTVSLPCSEDASSSTDKVNLYAVLSIAPAPCCISAR